MPMSLLLPAPARLLITTWWPKLSDNFAATKRAITSVGPPGAKGTIMRTDLVGYCGSAALAAPNVALAATATTMRTTCFLFVFTRFSWVIQAAILFHHSILTFASL